MNRKILLFVLFASVLALLAAILFVSNQPFGFGMAAAKPAPGKLNVIATFYPLEEFSRNVAGPLSDVTSVVSPGVEPHDYEPTPRDILNIQKADLFVVNGAGLDPWAEKLRPELERNGVRVIVMSEVLGSSQGSFGVDPHFWLDPILAQREVGAIRDALTEIDPIHGGLYRMNADQYDAKLAKLDLQYAAALRSCAQRVIISSHDAFGYLSRRYGFTSQAITGISPEVEPSPKRIADLAVLAKTENIRYIFFETLVSPKIAETLANEVGAGTLVFDPVEGLTPAERTAGDTYLTIMARNLAGLVKAMECKQ